jgi:thioredoxin-like negative regulator of GroEL
VGACRRCLVQAGDVDIALTSSRQLPAVAAQSSDVRGLIARARLAEGKRAEAIRIFAEVSADPDADDRWRYYYAAALLNASAGLLASRSAPPEAHRAGQELQQRRSRHPGHANVLALLGVAQLEAANPGGAINRTLTCGRRDPPETVTAIWRPMATAPDGVEGFVTSIEFTSAGP